MAGGQEHSAKSGPNLVDVEAIFSALRSDVNRRIRFLNVGSGFYSRKIGIRYSPTSGRGVYVTEGASLEAGELVLLENSLGTCTYRPGEGNNLEQALGSVAAVGGLKGGCGSNLQQLESLLSMELQRVEVQNQVDVNAWAIPAAQYGRTLGRIVSLINHSCEPNARISIFCQGTLFGVRATKKLRSGEELSVSYVNVLHPLSRRSQALSDWWDFTCSCARCVFERNLPSKIEADIKEACKLNRLSKHPTRGFYEKILRRCEPGNQQKYVRWSLATFRREAGDVEEYVQCSTESYPGCPFTFQLLREDEHAGLRKLYLTANEVVVYGTGQSSNKDEKGWSYEELVRDFDTSLAANKLAVYGDGRIHMQRTAEDFAEFLTKVRTGKRVTNEDILAFAKFFNDELTLDNISRSRLVSICKYMGIQPYGTDAYLRYSLRQTLARIKADDRMIQNEGIDSLSEAELRAACRERGILEVTSIEELKEQLRNWLDLSLNHALPSSLLILSRSFVSGKLKPEEAVQATLLSLPDEVVESVGVTVLPSEDALEERKRKLEYLQSQEEFIKEEAEDEQEEQDRLRKQEAAKQVDIALSEMNVATAKEAQELAKEKTKEQQDRLCKLSAALAVLASASSVSKERAELLRLVNKEIGLYNSMVNESNMEEAKKAYEAERAKKKEEEDGTSGAKISEVLINKVDSMLHKLEKEIDAVDAEIGDRWRILDRDYDGKVTAEELAAAALYIKDTLGSEPVQDLISRLAKDSEGRILVEDIVKLGSAADSELLQDHKAKSES